MSDVKKEFFEVETTMMENDVETMSESKKGFLAWVKAHKKQLILAGVSLATLIGIILGIKNKDVLAELWASLAERMKKMPSSTAISISSSLTDIPASVPDKILQVRAYTPPTKPVAVCRHIRTMSAGKHHSVAKAAEAAALGIDLPPNQTLVDSYTKYAA